MGKELNFELFSTKLSELVPVENKTKSEKEMQNEQDAALTWEILREWEDTSKVKDYGPEVFSRIISNFVSMVNHESDVFASYGQMFEASENACRVLPRKKRIL